MEIKILQVFLGVDGLPYKDQERTVHFPIVGSGFQGASNTTKIRFYYDELVEQDDTETAWVACAKLPNGKIGSKVLETDYDSTLGEHYALLELDSFYFQYKGDVYISLQGYQGGVQVSYDEETELYTIYGTPTIAATGSIKLSVNYATQFVGSGETSNVNFQRILADLGTKLGIRAQSEHVEELPSVGQNDIFYVVNDDPNDPNLANIYVWNENTQSYVWVGDNTLDLGDYYTTEQGEQFEEEIDNRVTSVESELTNVASGSPAGVYATVSDLTTADPDHSKIYLVSADGHWYYWNGSAWTDGGEYLTTLTGFTPCKLVPPYTDNGYISYTSSTNTFTFPVYTMILNLATGERYENSSVLSFTINPTSSAMVILFDWTNKVYFGVAYSQLSTYNNSRYSVAFTLRTTTKKLDIGIPYKIDGIMYGDIDLSKLENRLNFGSQNGLVTYNSKTMKLYIPEYFMITGRNQYDVHYKTTPTTIDLSSFGTSAVKIYFDTSDNDFKAIPYSSSLPETGILCGAVRTSINDYKVQLNFGNPYTNDGLFMGDIVPLKQRAFFKTIQHRGWKDYPENTIIAFQKDIELGYLSFECDVQLTSDGVAVLLHDATINRTARNADGTTISGDVYISQITYEQALTYDFGIYKGSQFAGTKIAKLDDLLKLCRYCSIKPYVELKDGSNDCGDEVYNLLQKYDLVDKTTITSFNASALSYIAQKSNKLRIALAVDTVSQTTIDNLVAIKTNYGNECILYPNETLNYKDYVSNCKTNGLKIEVWTVDYDTQYNRLDPYVSACLSDGLDVTFIYYKKGIML